MSRHLTALVIVGCFVVAGLGSCSSGKKTPQDIPLTVAAIQDGSAENHPPEDSPIALAQVVVTAGPADAGGSGFYLGLFVQDPGPAGPYKGIYVRMAPDDPLASQLVPGSTIALKGTYREVNGNSLISAMTPGDITILLQEAAPAPLDITPAQVAEEAYEGVQVRLVEPIAQGAPDADGRFLVATPDGQASVSPVVFADSPWTDHMRPGMAFAQLRGHVYQDAAGPHLAPSAYADFGPVVSVSEPGGDQVFWGGQAIVTLVASKPDAHMLYTTDGSPPQAGAATTTDAAAPLTIELTVSGTLRWAASLDEELEDPHQLEISLTSNFFSDISEASGIQEENYDPDPQISIASNDHSLVAFADLNGDGFDDVIASNTYPNPKNSEMPQEHLVFLNNGDKTFTNHSDTSGLRFALGSVLAFGDLDNDGDLDALSAFSFDAEQNGHNRVYLNDGTGVFSEKTDDGFDAISYPTAAASALLADFDGDADLDVFIANGHTVYNSIDRLFINNGDATFTDGTDRLVGNQPRVSNGAVTCDYDNDGDLDIIVITYSVSRNLGHNLLWENDGSGHFTEVAAARGWAAQATGNYWLESTNFGRDPEPDPDPLGYVGSNGFGVDCADVNNDGLLDIIAATISHPIASDYSRKWSDPSQVLINQGPAAGYSFVNEHLDLGLPFNEGELDCSAADFDNDGLLDLGKTRENKYEDGYSDLEQKGWFGLFHQNPDGSYQSVGLFAGINTALDNPDDPFLPMTLSHTHAWSDVDRDGDLDLLIGAGRNSSIPARGRPNYLFENTIGQENHWLSLRLQGDGTAINRDALGARVILTQGDGLQVREIKSSRGLWNPIDTRRVHFGLGRADPGDYQIEIRWPDGQRDFFDQTDLPADGFYTIHYITGAQAE